MRFIFTLLLFYTGIFPVFSQDRLFYFHDKKDSTLLGVRNESGKIIIAPQTFYGEAEESEEILEETIFLWDAPFKQNFDKNSPIMPIGAVYDRNGKYLYSPQFYDNGPDYWEEGVRRYAENNKLGLVDKFGKKLTSAKWDFIDIINYGYVKVYEGKLKKVYEEGGEHWSLGANGKINSYLINRKGEKAIPSKMKKHPKDYFFEGNYYPYPFRYTTEEQKILNNLEKDIIGISFYFKSSYYKYEFQPLQLEIIERPSRYQRYYVVKLFDNQESFGLSDEFYVDATTKKAFVDKYSFEKMELHEAMVESLREFLNSKDQDVIPQTRKIAEQELKRLKSLR